MSRSTINRALVALTLASALPLAACGDSSSPTAPTAAPPATETAAQPAAAAPAPPADTRPIVTATGVVVNLRRSGAGDLDISFRIDDATIVRAAGNTPVEYGPVTGATDSIRSGQTVRAEGRRDGEFLDATKLIIISQAPQ